MRRPATAISARACCARRKRSSRCRKPHTAPASALAALGAALRRAIAGSSGPFYATALLRASRRLADIAEPSARDCRGVPRRGGFDQRTGRRACRRPHDARCAGPGRRGIRACARQRSRSRQRVGRGSRGRRARRAGNRTHDAAPGAQLSANARSARRTAARSRCRIGCVRCRRTSGEGRRRANGVAQRIGTQDATPRHVPMSRIVAMSGGITSVPIRNQSARLRPPGQQRRTNRRHGETREPAPIADRVEMHGRRSRLRRRQSGAATGSSSNSNARPASTTACAR